MSKRDDISRIGHLIDVQAPVLYDDIRLLHCLVIEYRARLREATCPTDGECAGRVRQAQRRRSAQSKICEEHREEKRSP